ncbi:MAG: serine--tRNA ligase [Clostridiaceae bacterium]|nr:serine--tRNA ligase [Clostridiaceae bacterium]
MLDIQILRDDPRGVEVALAKRNVDIDLTPFLDLDRRRRQLIAETERLRAERNRVSGEIPRLKREGEPVEDLLTEMREVSEQIKTYEAELSILTAEWQRFQDELPNMPADDVAAGGKENNEPLRYYGTMPEFDFTPANHVDLAVNLNLIDYVRGVKLGGNGYWLYRGQGARLEWAMLNYFIDAHIADGYELMLVPHLLTERCGYTAGQFPKFRDDVFWLGGEDNNNFLLPTSETALASLYSDEVLAESDLPRKIAAFTPCYRREAGSYRAEERGMIRGHQFNKVEMFQFTRPADGETAFRELVDKACALVDGLGLHFRLTKLAAADCSASMAKTYDIEIWIPSMNTYKEVSSVSLAGDYQARRGNTRYRNAATGKLEFVYTLNGSGLATSRVFPAILEQMQQADGTVLISEVLRPYMGGLERLTPPEN